MDCPPTIATHVQPPLHYTDDALSLGIIPVELVPANLAKTLCSAVYVSGRQPEEAFRNSTPWSLQSHTLPRVMSRHAQWTLDTERRCVDVSLRIDEAVAAELVALYRAQHPAMLANWEAEERRLLDLGSVKRSAQHIGDQGTLIVPTGGAMKLGFEPQALRRGPAPSAGWAGPVQISSAAQNLVDQSFGDADAYHAAWLVVHRDRIIAEGYAPSLTPDQPLESWSMGKSVMATLIGLLVGRDALGLDQPAPIGSWQEPGDPRGRITIRNLLNMSSGLVCGGKDEPTNTWTYGIAEHFLPYTTAVDVEAFATQRPVRYAPNTVGRYRNVDTLTLSTIFHQTVLAMGGNPLTFPQTELFDQLGMHGFTHEPDRKGRFIISGFNYGTARDWARLGLLYLRDGVWQGKRILPEGWAKFVQTPAPAWQGKYGGQFHLNSEGKFLLPKDTFFMAGGGGQCVFIVPSLDLVIVRMGHTRGGSVADAKVNAVLKDLLATGLAG